MLKMIAVRTFVQISLWKNVIAKFKQLTCYTTIFCILEREEHVMVLIF